MNEIVTRTIEGEVLGPDKTVRVIGRPKPFSQEVRRSTLPSGLTVAELIDATLAGGRSHLADYAVYVDGAPVPREQHAKLRPEAGSTITFAPRLRKGDALKSVAMLAVAVVAIVASTLLFGPAGFFGSYALLASVTAAGIVAAGTLAVNALFPARPPKAPSTALPALASDGSARSNIYSLGGAQNQTDPFGPIPSILGKVRVWPRFAGTPITELVGDDQYLRLIFAIGYGPLSCWDFKIGETPIANYEGVELQFHPGHVPPPPLSIYPFQSFQENFGLPLDTQLGWQVRTTSGQVDYIDVEVVAPGGIYRLDDKGQRQNYTISVAAQIAPAGSGLYTPLGSRTVTGRADNPVRFAIGGQVPRGQYDVRVAKISADGAPESVVEDLQWTALRAYRFERPIVFPKRLVVAALRIKASSRLNNVISTFNCMAQSFVTPAIASAPIDEVQLSQNPADLFRWVLQGEANATPVPDEEIDFASLEPWRDYCVEQGWQYNCEHDTQAKTFDVLQDVAAAGRARVVRTDGRWGVAYDEADAPVAQHFTPRNSWDFSESRTFFDPPHGFRVRFINEEIGYQPDELLVYSDGFDATNATKYESIGFPGVTNPTLLHRLARFQLAQTLHRASTYTLSTNWQALSCSIGAKVLAQHDGPAWGLASARVKSVIDDEDAQSVTLDNEVLIESGKSYSIRFRLADGTSLLRSVTAAPGLTHTLGLASDVPMPMPDPGDLAMFGEATPGPTVALRVKDIQWQPDFRAVLTLVDDAPQIGLADQQPIPPHNSQVTPPPDLFSQPPVDLRVVPALYVDGGAPKFKALLSWRVVSAARIDSFLVEYRDRSVAPVQWLPAGTVPGSALTQEILDLLPGAYDFRVRAQFGNGEMSMFAQVNSVSMVSQRPADVTNFRASILGDLTTLYWDPVSGADSYVLRVTPDLETPSWNASVISQPRIDGTSIQVPSMIGTYLIKAVSLDGVESVNPAIVLSLTGGPIANVVATLTPAPDWAGEKTNVIVVDGRLRLAGFAGIPISEWPPVSEWVSFGIASEGLYVFDDYFDLGDVFTSRLSASIRAFGSNQSNTIASWLTLDSVETLAGGNSGAWGLRLEYKYTLDDPSGDPTWTDWAELQAGYVTARAFWFRLRLFSYNPSITPIVEAADPSIDMPDRVEPIGDLVVPQGGTHVTFDEPFLHLSTVVPTAVQDAVGGDHVEISNRDELGFDVIVLDINDDPVIGSRTVDAVAIGYGRRAV